MRNKLPLLLLMLVNLCRAASPASEDDYVLPTWKEEQSTFPAAPQLDDLVPFYPGPSTDNRFFVDSRTLAVGKDGVIRYVLVVVSPQGAKSVTFEGMRCETRERRIYAVGRADGSWAAARRSEWLRISDVAGNRHHAALFLEYFCPDGVTVSDVARAREELQKNARFSPGSR